MDFKFYMPTKVLIEKNGVLNNSSMIASYGKKALIVTGRSSSKKNGSLDDVINALEKKNVSYVVFDEIEENPTVESVCKAASLGKDNNIDFIVGVGGGSPIDASKAIGIMIKNKDVTADTLFTDRVLESVAIIAVPTTAGTGTETTQYCILTDHKAKTKRNLGQEVFPKVSLVDARYMMNMPMTITRNTAFDALSHIIEGYLNTNASFITDGLCEKALSIWGECIPALLKGELSFEDREKLMIASSMAGMIIAQTGTSIPHGMGYNLTYFKNVPHGIANGCLYKEYLKVFKNREKVEKLPALLGISNTEFDEMVEKLTNVSVEITEEEIVEWSKDFAKNEAKLKNHPEKVTEQEIFTIYKNSLMK